MKVYSSPKYDRALKKVLRKNPHIELKIKNKLELYKTNPEHPSLRLHKLTGNQKENWAISVEEDVRLIFSYIPDGIYLLAIGKHEEVY